MLCCRCLQRAQKNATGMRRWFQRDSNFAAVFVVFAISGTDACPAVARMLHSLRKLNPIVPVQFQPTIQLVKITWSDSEIHSYFRKRSSSIMFKVHLPPIGVSPIQRRKSNPLDRLPGGLETRVAPGVSPIQVQSALQFYWISLSRSLTYNFA